MISEEQLKTITNEKGSWAPIDYRTLRSILDRNQNISKMIPGGSGANVIKGLSSLGVRCALVGKIGSDDKGEFYLKVMNKMGIVSYLEKGNLPTGQAICLVTPDGQRTFRTYLGASHSLTDITLDPQIFENTTIFHIEGYQLVDRDLVIRSLKLAKEKGIKVSMDLANVEVVRRNRDFILKILPKYVDIIFCNEREAEALVDLPASGACTALSAMCDIALVTMSERGCWTQRGKEKFYTPAESVNAIDTTGAGDLFASGFLYGYLKDEPLNKCSWLGALVASYVVKMIGAEIPDQIWDEIHERIRDDWAKYNQID